MELKQKTKMTKKSKLVLSLLVNSFTFFSILFFAPLDIYLGNIINFNFSFNSFWWILLLFALSIVLIVSVIEMFFPELLCQISNALVFAIGICCYIQSMFLNGSMQSLVGVRPKYADSLKIENIAIWLVMIVAIIVFTLVALKYHKSKIFNQTIGFLSIALILMQLSGLVSTLLSVDVNSYRRGQYFTNEGEFELSSDNNVIVFILDTCDANYFESVMNSDSKISEQLKGFTYYPNMTGTYSRTFPSVPYLLTDVKCYFDQPYYSYIDQAYSQSTFLKDLKDTNTDIRIYTDNQYLGKDGSKYISNVAEVKDELNLSQTIKIIRKMAKVSLYRSSPYLIKARFYYTNNEINNVYASVNAAIKEDEIKFYNTLTDQKLSTTNSYDSSYRFYHLFGPHPGVFFDENLNPKEDADYVDGIKGDFNLISEYIQQMQELGIYDESTIIITADHGNQGGFQETIGIYEDFRPVLLMKPAGKGMTDDFTISSAPISHEDLFPTILDATGGNGSKYGKDIQDISKNEARERYFYYTGLYSDEDGEIALMEYLISGDARDFNNWKYTGKYWDIDYSERTVSKHRMKEYDLEASSKNN